MTAAELAKRILHLETFSLYDAYDNSGCGTIEDVLRELQNTIENAPENVILYLIETIEELTA